MALMGAVRSGGHGHGHGAAKLGHGHGPLKVGHGPFKGAHSHTHHGAHGHGLKLHAAKGVHWLLHGLSPIDVLAMAMGAGALGVIGRKVFRDEQLAVWLAVAGAVLMDLLVVRPLFKAIFRFASTPSSGLEGLVSQVAEAATTFDAAGRGLVKVLLDGQTSQILATLESDERESGVKVARGDMLVVTDVDAGKGVCRVSREIATSEG